MRGRRRFWVTLLGLTARFRGGALLAILGLVALWGPPQARGALIAVNVDTGTFYSVSTTNAALTVIANPGITNLAEIERAPDGTLYGFTDSAVPTPTLYRFNSTTFAPTAIGPLNIGFVFEGGLAFSPGGVAYGTNQGDAGTPKLFTLNLTTGAATLVGTISGGSHDINGLAYRSDGKLIGLDRVTNSLLVIDPTTAASSVLAPISATVGSVGGMTVDNGTFYFSTAATTATDAGSNQLFSFDPFTGVQTLIGSFAPTISSGDGISGLASSPQATAAVPEPSTLALLALGGVGLASWRRWRAKRSQNSPAA
jgi:hypothetical protein